MPDPSATYPAACPLPLRAPIRTQLILGWITALTLLVTPLRATGSSNVILSEILAASATGLADADGDSSDWIELRNLGPDAVDLAGWYLTDDPRVPDKWTFPNTPLAGGGFLVVFASGKDRRQAGAELHTNFQLGSDGGYLALVRPDGTVASAFSPGYPKQRADVSFGFASQVSSTALITNLSPARLLVPGSEADYDTNWPALDFNDTPWLAATNGFGFGATPGFGALIQSDLGERMLGQNSSVLVRIPFTIERPADLGRLWLRMKYDDGFRAFLNGIPVAARNVRALVTGSTDAAWTSTLQIRSATNNPPYEGTLQLAAVNLHFGTSVSGTLNGIAFHNLNLAASTTGTRIPLSGAAPGVTLDYRFGCTADCPGNRPLTTQITGPDAAVANGLTLGNRYVTGAAADHRPNLMTFHGLAPDQRVYVQLIGGQHGWNSTTTVFVNGDGVTEGSGTALAAWISNQTTSTGAGLFGFETRATPGGDLTLEVQSSQYSGLAAVIVLGEPARAQALNDWNLSAATAHADSAAVIFETFDLRSWIPLLHPGTNVLAIQGLNLSAADPDFLMVPELEGQVFSGDITTLQYFSEPSPGTANGSGLGGLVEDVRFSRSRGYYDSPFTVELSTATDGAQIHFTTDGSRPSPGSPGTQAYGNALTLSGTTTLRAAAFRDGFFPSSIKTHTYIFPEQVRGQVRPPGHSATLGGVPADYEVDPDVVGPGAPYAGVFTNALRALPTISIVMDDADLFGPQGIYNNPLQSGEDWERACSVEYFDPAGPDDFQENAGVRVMGNSSRNPVRSPKHGLRLLFRSRYGSSRLRFPLFGPGVTEFEKIALRSNSFDGWTDDVGDRRRTAQFLRDEFFRIMQRDMGGLNSRGFNAHLYLNGLYWGIYNPIERPDASFAADHLGGRPEDYDVLGVNGELIDGTLDAWNRLMAQANAGLGTDAAYQRVQGNNPDGTRNPAYEVLINVPNLIDYVLANFYGTSLDWGANWFGWRNRTTNSTGFQFAMYDSELVMLNGGLGDGTPRLEQNYVTIDPVNHPAHVFQALKANAEFRVRVGDHIQRHFLQGGAMTPAANIARYQALAATLAPALSGESARWGDHRRDVLNGISGPYVLHTPADWELEHQALLTNYFPQRTGIVLGQLRAAGLFPALAAPFFNQLGGDVPAGFQLEMIQTNASGSILFTLDGSDPRLPGGAVAPAAQSYSVPVSLNARTVVRARVRSGTTWSPLVEATFRPAQDFSRLLVSEIMYHPPGSGLVDGDEFEFLELKNAGTNSLDLSGFFFSAGITFTFPSPTLLDPGALLVLVRNPAQFALRYPGVSFHGVYSGRLNNGGETLTLAQPPGTPVLSVTYDNSLPWPATPDGFGFSLVPAQASASLDPDQASAWRASSEPGGSPGRDDPDSALPAIRINEVLSRSETGGDFIELFNPTSAAVDLGGWFLTDDPAVPAKFRIPAGTLIDPLGLLVFSEADFNPTPGTNGSFALNAAGDEVYLFSGDARTNLTGYSHGFSFGASADASTLGRHVLSTGEEQFPPQLAASPGQPNAGPRVGPVVFTEIHYHPLAGEESFVELRNISTNTVPLFDPAMPAHSWRINGLGYVFPTNLLLDPGQWLLVVSTNPASFRARHALPAEVPVLGPYSGTLQHSGERLELQRPEEFSTNGTLYITVDEIRYNDKSPWPPGADGSGPSLQRKSLAAYGNDPANWEAASPTPGTGLPGGERPIIVSQPQDQVISAGQTAVFRVEATGPGPLRYQWRFKGDPINEGNGPSLTLSNVAPAQAGTYTVIVFNDAGSAASAVARLVVNIPPLLIFPPANQTVRVGGNTSFSVQAVGNGLLRYQWLFNGNTVPNATNATLNLTNVQLTQGGRYSVRVRDAIGIVTSPEALLFVAIPPVILQQPLSVSVPAGGSATFSITISGDASWPLGYRWRRNGATLSTIVLNRNICFFTVSNLQAAGNYTVVVTNAANPSGVLSTTAIVTVLPDTDQDGMPDDWENTYHLDPNDPRDALADVDRDGRTNLEEYTAGTNPVDATSRPRLAIDHRPPAAPQLSFESVANRTYAIDWREAVDLGRWSRLADIAARPTNFLQRIDDPYPVAAGRVYRLITPRPPDPAPGPAILRSPVSIILNPGEDAALDLQAVGSGPLRYQWSLNGSPVPGATQTKLLLPGVQDAQSGAYTVVVTDQTGSTTNQPPAMVVLRPSIVLQPASQTVDAGATVTLRVAASGTEPLQYRWTRGGRFVRGATGPSLAIANAQASDSGVYQAIVSQLTPLGWISTTSSNAIIVVR